MKHIIEGKPAQDRSQNTTAASVRLLEVDEDSAGQRLDNFLMRHLKGVPKTHVYRIIRSGEVRINKGRVSAETRVQTGDMVRLPPVRISEKVAEKAERPAPAKDFPALLEDEYMVALSKPAGVAVHGEQGVRGAGAVHRRVHRGRARRAGAREVRRRGSARHHQDRPRRAPPAGRARPARRIALSPKIIPRRAVPLASTRPVRAAP